MNDEQKSKIVAMLSDIMGHEYFYDPKSDEVFYWRVGEDSRVVTDFGDFINQAYDKWASTPTQH